MVTRLNLIDSTCMSENPGENTRYSLLPGVRARREEFGLLFHNNKDGKLTFVRSGNLIEIFSDSKDQSLLRITPEGAGKEKVQRLIKILLQDGLIAEV